MAAQVEEVVVDTDLLEFKTSAQIAASVCSLGVRGANKVG